MKYLDSLNPAQQEAVKATEGPVLVLAGAGTGKTKVLTVRFVHLLKTENVFPSQILGVTFTNKSANEIKNRVSELLSMSVDGWFIGTFHSLALRLLRPHAGLVGLRDNFTILNEDDQIRLVKQIFLALDIDEKKYQPKIAAAIINRWKDKFRLPKDVMNEKGSFADGKMGAVYDTYQERLKTLNACDFGDLLLHHLTVLRENPDILASVQRRFKYIMVDEYQDTNTVQYLWLRLLAQSHKNICCVGDEDQSIYGWRGAEVGNILRFEEDFPNAKVIRLEQNYRSGGHILGAASGLISNNNMRLGKTLWTAAEDGEKVSVQSFFDDREETRYISDETELLNNRGTRLNEIAVMVRAGFQTRVIEERFIQIGLPYRVLVGARFYERAEIRDAIAYLRLLVSSDNDLGFERIINTPKRGIGEASLKIIQSTAREYNISLMAAAGQLIETDTLKPKLKHSLSDFVKGFQRWRGLLSSLPHSEVAEMVLDESGYMAALVADKSPESESRIENLKELIHAISEFENINAFLEHVSLVMEAAENTFGDQVSIMTLHGAKGLEFEIVFLPGWEEDLFPSKRAIDEHGIAGLEEERRLAYVGITRAKKKAYISCAANRFLYGHWIRPVPSRFIDELPEEHIEKMENVKWKIGNGDEYNQEVRSLGVSAYSPSLAKGWQSRSD
ncbi:MAG: UvrD-helicase domain-containing protein [Alphaproteobacteria bacterium]|nr:UvrD-helicase domain-containing protein [Alphaproteobacteria bacterium]MCL2505122.1 UvrD-helicase domain-containing protein [Alphaproteobacteria bacterium]